jgi:hypothetical protein
MAALGGNQARIRGSTWRVFGEVVNRTGPTPTPTPVLRAVHRGTDNRRFAGLVTNVLTRCI